MDACAEYMAGVSARLRSVDRAQLFALRQYSREVAMTLPDRLIVALWLIFIVYWAVMAVGAKKNIGRRPWWRESGLRVGVLVLIILALRLPVFHHALQNAHAHTSSADMVMGLVGVALCTLGIGLAIWARVCLGRNWGMPMSRKEHPEFITSGPYAAVRHPIYTGFIIAMLGSSIAVSVIWVIPLVILGIYYIYSARKEEKLMKELFPEQYSAYMQRTRMFVPFLL
jgi:protein-S-isoprenylcysteine O-methyltransferase Ste14